MELVQKGKKGGKRRRAVKKKLTIDDELERERDGERERERERERGRVIGL